MARRSEALCPPLPRPRHIHSHANPGTPFEPAWPALQGRRRRGREGGGVEASRAAATRAMGRRGRRLCMRAAGRRGWQRRGPRAARGDKCSDVAKGYTCDPNPGRGFSHAPGL